MSLYSAISSLALASLLLLTVTTQTTVSTISTPMTAQRWDYTQDWQPMLFSAASKILQDPADNGLPEALRLDLIHTQDVRVASTVRYDVVIALSNKGQSTASASFYDPFFWAPLSGLTVHSDLWAAANDGDKSSAGADGLSHRPQLLELPAAADEPWQPSGGAQQQIAKHSGQAEPLHPSQLPTAMELAMPLNHVRLWLADPAATNLQIVGPESVDTDLIGAGDIESVELALPADAAAGSRRPTASGIERLSLKHPVQLDVAGNLVHSAEPLELLVEGGDVQIVAAHELAASPSGPTQLQVSLPGVVGDGVGGGVGGTLGGGGVDAGGGWEHELKAGGDPRLDTLRELVHRLAEQTGLQPTAIADASAAPVLMLSMAFVSSKALPSLVLPLELCLRPCLSLLSVCP
eukprot:SAG22_NODE_602_length_8663_cov_17.617936_3_plen_406_part_00